MSDAPEHENVTTRDEYRAIRDSEKPKTVIHPKGSTREKLHRLRELLPEKNEPTGSGR